MAGEKHCCCRGACLAQAGTLAGFSRPAACGFLTVEQEMAPRLGSTCFWHLL